MVEHLSDLSDHEKLILFCCALEVKVVSPLPPLPIFAECASGQKTRS